jgi:hypothetical protein
MNRNIFAFLIFLIGLGVLAYSATNWVQEGMPTNDIVPYKNSFGKNSLHGVYLGIIFVCYGVIEYVLTKEH